MRFQLEIQKSNMKLNVHRNKSLQKLSEHLNILLKEKYSKFWCQKLQKQNEGNCQVGTYFFFTTLSHELWGSFMFRVSIQANLTIVMNLS